MSHFFYLERLAVTYGVYVYPGEIELTRIPLGPSSQAMFRANW